MSIRWLWILSAVLIGACSTISRPSLYPEDCLARNDCYLVKVDNTGGEFPLEFRINGAKYGDVPSYQSARYSLYRERLIHGNCASVSVRPISNAYGSVLRSVEQCIYPGQYYQVDVTNNQRYIWLTPFWINNNNTK